MEKALRLYKIPDVESIITVIGSGDTLPASGFSENDLFINIDTEVLYKAEENQSQQLQWVQIQFDETKYYRDSSSETPLFYAFSQQYGLNEYDVSFPQNAERAAEITSFTYSATRMGNAPTISGTLMYRQCLDELWTDRVCVFFNKKFYFIDKIPTSEYNNTDERYKHSCEFVSENKLLENVYFTNVVDIEHYEEDITKLPMQWLDFTFFGGINEFVSRLNLSLAYSGLDAQHVGFRVVADALPPVEEKLITISNTTLKAALDMIYETWEIPYWFDGYTIHIGYSNEQQMQQAGITMPTFQYGAVQSLLSLQKSQSNDIVNRITGFGSSENIPTFYPNKNPNAIELQYQRNQTLMVDYARIANPYKTTRLEPSKSVQQGVPSGSYFKYMPILKTYNYDQFVTINPHMTHSIANADDPISGGTLLVSSEIPNYNIRMKYFTQDILSVSAFEHGATEAFAVKYAWVWLRDGDFQNLTFVDDWQGLFANYITGYVKVKSFNITHEQFEHNSMYTTSFSASQTANIINLTYSPTNIPYTNVQWSDGVVGESYEARMPFEINSIPQGTTCLLFMFARKYPKNIYDDDLVAFLKNTTQFVATHQVLSSPDWSLNADGHVAQLWRYGIRLNSGVTPLENDIIYFTREAGALPYFGQLLPYSFRETNDIWLNAKNNEYLKENGTDYYSFENLYKVSCAKEHVENFDDIKPTIKEMLNNETPAKRIDQIIDVAFDQNDNNDLQENGTDYQHPYFYVKLAKTSLDNGYSFNLFDCAIDSDKMKLNMADGNCGGCTFEIMVDYKSGMATNPIGVFTEATTINGVTYAAGTPYRNAKGDVMTSGAPNTENQQDTSAAEVWIALKKDNETFGSYDNGAEVVLPDSKKGENFIPEEGDSFTIINICLPYAYIVAAEQRLYHALLDYMENNNPRTWSFSIKFSSIYYKKHYEFMDKWFNESSEVPFVYNNITRKYFVQSYSYKMSSNSSLPEVTVELNEKVKKRNVYYIAPYNPYEYYQTVDLQQQQKRLKKAVSDYMSGAVPQNINAENMQISGDIILSNGVSLNAQINAFNSQIFSNEQVNTPDNVWAKIKNISEAENLFKDGLFVTEHNEITATDSSVSKIEDGVFGKDGIRIEFDGNEPSIDFEQRVFVEEESYYTVVFYARSESEIIIDTIISYFDDSDKIISFDVFDKKQLSENWEKIVFLITTPLNSSYLTIKISKSSS